MEFSVAEINFICIVKGENRKDTINNIFDVLPDLEDKEMIEIAETVTQQYPPMNFPQPHVRQNGAHPYKRHRHRGQQLRCRTPDFWREPIILFFVV